MCGSDRFYNNIVSTLLCAHVLSTLHFSCFRPSTESITFEEMGPVIINSDGTTRRIDNWDQMTKGEQEVAWRRIAKRNEERREVLLERQQEQQEQQKESEEGKEGSV